MIAPPSIPGRLRGYLLENNCMVHSGRPVEAHADLRAVVALQNAEPRPAGRGFRFLLPALADDAEARWELAAYLDSLAGLVADGIVTAREVGFGAVRLREIANEIDPKARP